jgi:hypothetical protein
MQTVREDKGQKKMTILQMNFQRTNRTNSSRICENDERWEGKRKMLRNKGTAKTKSKQGKERQHRKKTKKKCINKSINENKMAEQRRRKGNRKQVAHV